MAERPLKFQDVLNQLKEPLSQDIIKQGESNSGRSNAFYYNYVEWHDVADILDRVCPEWSHEVHSIKQIGDLVAVTASITILGVTRQGIGTGSAYDETGIKKAEHDALKRAAIKFGLARELYKTETNKIETDKRNFPAEPMAKTMAELCTPRQLVAIRAISNDKKIDVEKECQELMYCKPEELSRKAASALIDYLKNYEQEFEKHTKQEVELKKPTTITGDFQSFSETNPVAHEPKAEPQPNVTRFNESNNSLVNKAKAIAAMGLVTRDYEGFNVTSPGFKKETFRIWKDEEGKVKCSCSEFEQASKDNPKFRCEHILAVKFHIEATEDVEPEANNAGVTEDEIPVEAKPSKKGLTNSQRETIANERINKGLDVESISMRRYGTETQFLSYDEANELILVLNAKKAEI